MRLLLSAFGLGTALYSERLAFARMPAVSMSAIAPEFVPDYPVFLMFDEFVVDSMTVDMLRAMGDQERSWFSKMHSVLDALESSGRLIIQDYDGIVHPHSDAIRESVRYHLRNMSEWAPVFEESLERWRDFSHLGRRMLKSKGSSEWSVEDHQLNRVFETGSYFHLQSLEQEVGNLLHQWKSKMSRDDRAYARHVVGEYLAYVLGNLCIAESASAVIHDWQDLEPIYRKIFRLSMRRDGQLEEAAQARELFAVLFPEFHLTDATSFAKALDDGRVETLRDLVRSAATGALTFDQEFANATLREVLKVERAARFRRKVVGWATLPLGFVPWLGTPLQKATEEAVARQLESAVQKDKEWFYLVSELSSERVPE